MVTDWSPEEGRWELVDAERFFTRSLAWALTHLTADIAFFSPLPPGETDYEKWKFVFNAIQGLEEVKYFVCVREKSAVLGRFSSLKPLERALAAIVQAKAPCRTEKTEMKWLDEVVAVEAAPLPPELLSGSSSVTSRSDIKLTSWCYCLWKKMCCMK